MFSPVGMEPSGDEDLNISITLSLPVKSQG